MIFGDTGLDDDGPVVSESPNGRMVPLIKYFLDAGRVLSAMILDLHHSKGVEFGSGHAADDTLLPTLARALYR